MLEKTRGELEAEFSKAIIKFETDMSTKTGERVIVLTVDANLDEQFRKSNTRR